MSDIIRVLIVNDDENIADMWQTKVVNKQPDMEAEIALNGEDAVAASAEYQPDVVIMDVMMPGNIDGIEATEQILAQGNNTQVVVYSGRNDIAQRALDAGAVRFMGLPILPDQLVKVIREVAQK